jgi:hypothetical protein
MRILGTELTHMKSLRNPTLYLIIFLTCSGLRLIHFSDLNEFRVFPDTAGYVNKATWPLWSSGERLGPLEGSAVWLLRGRSLTVPLFYKLVGNVPLSIATFQLFFSIVCWGLLALAVTAVVQTDLLKLVAFLFISLFSLSDQIVMWDGFLLSDSIALSLMVLFIANWLWLLNGWHCAKVMLLLIVGFLWVFSRDTNAWAILMLSCLLLTAGIVSSRRYLFLATVFIAIFVMNEISQNYSKRWLAPFVNVIGKRILPDPKRTAYFEQLGMPVAAEVMRMSGQLAWSRNRFFYKEPALNAFRAWVQSSGKTSYMRFMLAHPFTTTFEPFQNVEELFAPRLDYYRAAGFSPILEGSLAEAVYPERRPMLLLWVPGLLLLLSFLAAGRSIKQIWIVPVLLIVLAYPHAALAWHGDSNDVGRHALLAGVHLRLGFWLLLICLGDLLLVTARQKWVLLGFSDRTAARVRN